MNKFGNIGVILLTIVSVGMMIGSHFLAYYSNKNQNDKLKKAKIYQERQDSINRIEDYIQLEEFKKSVIGTQIKLFQEEAKKLENLIQETETIINNYNYEITNVQSTYIDSSAATIKSKLIELSDSIRFFTN